MKKLISILLCIFAINYGLWAQETIVVGEIYDANTGVGIPNVNIYIQGGKIGTTSNQEGLFLLRAQLEQARTMVVSAVGYHTERFKIEPHTQAGVEIALREKVGNLGEVFITPKTNPALPLMEKVRAKRQENANLNMTQEESSTALYVSDIQAKHLQRALWRNLQAGMIKQDSTYIIPLYWRHEQKDSTQEKATFLTETDYQVLLSQLPKAYNFYNNTLPIFNASMLSPLAAAGNTY
jgi:hypothetical protein